MALVIGASSLGFVSSTISSLSSDASREVGTVQKDAKAISEQVSKLSTDLQSVRRSTETITAEEKAIRVLVETRLGGISVALEEANKKLADAEKARISESQRVAILEKELARTKMIEAARAEGKVVVYTAMAIEIIEALNTAFKQKYGINVEYFRASTTALAAKIESEMTGGASTADIVDITGDVLDFLMKKGWVEPYRSPEAEAIPKQYWLDKDGYYPWNRILPYPIVINTKVIKPEDAPKNYMDMLNPKFKGKIGIADPFVHGTTTTILEGMKKILGNDWKAWIKGILVDQQPLQAVSLTPTAKMVATGEVGIALTVLPPLMVELDRGAPVTVLPFENTLVTAQWVVVIKGAKHPNAAKLYFDFFLSQEGQTLMSKLGQTSVRPGIPGTVTRVGLDKVKLFDFGYQTTDEIKKTRDELKSIVGK